MTSAQQEEYEQRNEKLRQAWQQYQAGAITLLEFISAAHHAVTLEAIQEYVEMVYPAPAHDDMAYGTLKEMCIRYGILPPAKFERRTFGPKHPLQKKRRSN